MNGRTVYKLLLKSKISSFWGERTALTVRAPINLVEPPPHSRYKTQHDEFKTKNGYQLISINHITCSKKPAAITNDMHFLDQDKCGHYHWWEGSITYNQKSTKDHDYDFTQGVSSPMPVEDIADYIKLNEWQRKHFYGDGSRNWETGECFVHPLIDELHTAGNAAKAIYGDYDDNYLYLTYSVKSAYNNRMRHVASGLKKAFKLAKKYNVKLRAYPGK